MYLVHARRVSTPSGTHGACTCYSQDKYIEPIGNKIPRRTELCYSVCSSHESDVMEPSAERTRQDWFCWLIYWYMEVKIISLSPCSLNESILQFSLCRSLQLPALLVTSVPSVHHFMKPRPPNQTCTMILKLLIAPWAIRPYHVILGHLQQTGPPALCT